MGRILDIVVLVHDLHHSPRHFRGLSKDECGQRDDLPELRHALGVETFLVWLQISGQHHCGDFAIDPKDSNAMRVFGSLRIDLASKKLA